MDGRIKEYYFDEINNMDNFDAFFEDEMEAMYQPIVDKKAAKAAAKDLSEEFIEEPESDSLNDDTYGI
jgi:hypothetical protein